MINIIYWTLSGNTQMMAEAIGEGVKESGKEVNVTNVNSIIADDLKDEQVFALGASAMGDEELDLGEDSFGDGECRGISKADGNLQSFSHGRTDHSSESTEGFL